MLVVRITIQMVACGPALRC